MIAIVTGAGSGIGRAVTAALIKEGFSVVLAGRRVEALTAARQHADPGGTQSRVVATDVTDPASVDRLFDATRDAFGRLDVLFNNAGISAPGVPLDRSDGGAVARRRRHQPDRRLSVHARGLPDDEGAVAAGRADHQQRLDLRARAAAELGALHRHQARDHRADEIHVARRPRVRHRLRADRHRQCRDGDDGANGRRRPPGERRR